MPRTIENPFEPRLEGVPLALTVDGRSMSGRDADLEERDFLFELAATPLVDALVLDASPDLEVQCRRGYLADPDLQRDSRTIAQTGAPSHFFGGVQPWSSRERRADELGLTGKRREWFLYYEAVTWYHRNSGHHFFVTADRRLLRELTLSKSAGNWRDRRIVSISQALRFVGLLMVSRNRLYLEARNGYTRTADPYNLYFELAYALAPSRLRLHNWLKDAPSDLPIAELEELQESVYGRVMDLLRARDGAALVALRTQQSWATVDETLYHLRYAVLTATALVDSIAVFSQRALRIDANDVGGVPGVSLNAPKFRKRLRAEGANRLADTAARSGELWRAINEIRNPIAHAAGPSGVTYQVLGRPSESRIKLEQEQAEAVKKAARAARTGASEWGVHEAAQQKPFLEPARFLSAFGLRMIGVADDLIDALADDLGAQRSADVPASGVWKDLPKLALLAGVTALLRT